MTDTGMSNEQELQKCSDCRCSMLLKYFGETKKGAPYKCCLQCRTKRKAIRATPEYKANRKAYGAARYEKNKEKISKQTKEWYENNKERKLTKNKEWSDNNKEKHKELTKKWFENNQEKHKANQKKYNENNKERFTEWRKDWYDKNRDTINEKNREKRKNDPVFKITTNLRNRVCKTIQKGYKSAKTLELLGCSREELMAHIESQFTEGMSWDKYGTFHIDHIKPCSAFNLLDPEEQRKCFHYTNLQPLWAIDNLKKGATYTPE